MSIQRDQNLISNPFSSQLKLPRNLMTRGPSRSFKVDFDLFGPAIYGFIRVLLGLDLKPAKPQTGSIYFLAMACFSFTVKTIIKSALYSFPCVHIDPQGTTCERILVCFGHIRAYRLKIYPQYIAYS